MLELLGLVALGLFIGAFGTLIGAGGGFILVPALLLLYPDDMEPAEITSVSLGVVFMSAVSGSIGYARQRRIDYQTGMLFAAAAAPGVIAGAFAVQFIPGPLFTAAFGLMLIGLSVVTLRNRPTAIRQPLRGRGVLVRRLEDPEGRTYVYAYRAWHAAALGVGIGFVSSLFGIGGGVIQVPSMIMLLHIPVQFAIPTSLFSLAFMSGGATAVHAGSGTLSGDELAMVVALALGAIPGSQLGALLSRRIRGRVVLVLLASAIGLLGCRLLVRAILGF